MVKHIILWTLNPELGDPAAPAASPAQAAASPALTKSQIKAEIKSGLESLKGIIPGLIDIKVITDGLLPSSNCDLMLDSTLESPEALKAYAVHPAHVEVANTKVRPYTVQRTCIDFEL